VIRNQTGGPVSLFTHGTREGFVGVYHPRTSSGTVHVAEPAELPVHKVWSWGHDRDAAAWREALSDDDSAYVELQAGLFRNQETYAFLEPQETVRFSEYWVPVRDLGGITRASVDAVLHMERTSPTRVRLALDVTRDIDARLIVRDGTIAALDTRVTLTPREPWRAELDVSAGPVTFELTDAAGHVLLVHTENVFDRTSAAQVSLGAQRLERASRSAEPSAAVEIGLVDELEGRRLSAMATYRAALEHHPTSLALLKAAGRLAVALGWAEAGASPAIEWLDAAYTRNTTDFEVRYYLGLALAAAGRAGEARPHLEAAQRFRATRVTATIQLARLAAANGQLDAAVARLQRLHAESTQAAAAGAFEVSLLRRLGRAAEARERARQWRAIDPISSLLRNELTRLGEPDPELWIHLGADANRVLDLVDQYLSIGAHADALELLDRAYPRVEPPAREIGAVPPRDSPLVAYYRGYVRGRLGGSGGGDYEVARSLPTAYVFPNRRSSYAVLRAAIEANPQDSVARFLLGSAYLASGLVEPAIETWQRVRHVRPAIPTLHRNLGLALLHGPGDYEQARAVLEEGAAADSENVDVYLSLDGALSAAGASPRERVAALRRFPATDRMPSSLIFKLALALAEAGHAAEAEGLFLGRFFPREEGGTSVRAVYAQVRLTSARIAADKGHCAETRKILDALSSAQPELPFTSGGLRDTSEPPAMARQVAALESACGRRDDARTRWQRLEHGFDGDSGPLAVAVADEARQRLGKSRTAAQRVRLEQALDDATRTLDSGGTSNPGLMEYARASLLAALGRADDSRRSRRRVFIFPDRNLSHALARTPPSLARETGELRRGAPPLPF
jgi:tetratricopeptide (TPR) repeat protein